MLRVGGRGDIENTTTSVAACNCLMVHVQKVFAIPQLH